MSHMTIDEFNNCDIHFGNDTDDKTPCKELLCSKKDEFYTITRIVSYVNSTFGNDDSIDFPDSISDKRKIKKLCRRLVTSGEIKENILSGHRHTPVLNRIPLNRLAIRMFHATNGWYSSIDDNIPEAAKASRDGDTVSKIPSLTHVTEDGSAIMVDVGHKPLSSRTATASGMVSLGSTAFLAVKNNEIRKGDVLAVSRIAGIMATKQTSQIIPLCHNIPLTKVTVEFEFIPETYSIKVLATVKTVEQTGVEMEALTAVTVSALTIYDMCKGVNHEITINEIRLEKKTGGKKDFVRTASR